MDAYLIDSAINAQARLVISRFKAEQKGLSKVEKEALKMEVINEAWAKIKPLNVSRPRFVKEIGILTGAFNSL